MENNVQEVLSSLTRQISELSIKLALAEAEITSLKNSTNEES